MPLQGEQDNKEQEKSKESRLNVSNSNSKRKNDSHNGRHMRGRGPESMHRRKSDNNGRNSGKQKPKPPELKKIQKHPAESFMQSQQSGYRINRFRNPINFEVDYIVSANERKPENRDQYRCNDVPEEARKLTIDTA